MKKKENVIVGGQNYKNGTRVLVMKNCFYNVLNGQMLTLFPLVSISAVLVIHCVTVAY